MCNFGFLWLLRVNLQLLKVLVKSCWNVCVSYTTCFNFFFMKKCFFKEMLYTYWTIMGIPKIWRNVWWKKTWKLDFTFKTWIWAPLDQFTGHWGAKMKLEVFQNVWKTNNWKVRTIIRYLKIVNKYYYNRVQNVWNIFEFFQKVGITTCERVVAAILT